MRPIVPMIWVAGVALAAGACAKPAVESGTSSSSTTSALPASPTQGSAKPTTTVVAGPAGSRAQSLPCQAMSRFVLDLFIADEAKTGTPEKKQEILTAIEGHATDLKLTVPALSAGVDVRVAYVRALLGGTPTAEQKQAEDVQGKVFDDWFKQNGCLVNQ